MASYDQHPLPAVPGPGGGLAMRQAVAPELLVPRSESVTLADDRIDLKTLWRTLVKYRWTILGISALCTLAAIVYTLRTPPQYQSAALLQIDRVAQKVVGFNADAEMEESPLSDQLQLRTQIELLKSRSLAERVVDNLGLYSTAAPGSSAPQAAPAPETASGVAAEWLERLRAMLSPSPAGPNTLSRAQAVAQFERSVAVEPVRNSRLVEIRVSNEDPEMAARMANAMAQAFIASNIERKLGSSVYARDYLEGQIRETKAKLEESERVINDYAKKNAILNLGEKGNATTQTFVDFSSALSRAEQERIQAETLYNQVRLNPESAPQAVVNEAIRAYKEQRARLEADYAKNLAIYKPDYPAMVQARAQIADLQARINTEVNNILASIRGQYLAAKKTEDQLRSRVASSRSEVLSVQDRSVDMNLLTRELDTNRQVYDSLLQRLKEVSVTAGITTNNVTVVDSAAVPLLPAKPDMKVNVGLGVMLGLFLGLLTALLREQLDDSVKNVNDIEGRYRLPLLGLIPFTKPEKGYNEPVALLAHRQPRSTFAESYRSMRTALQFSTADGAPQRFMVTSCGKGEGKTTTALALAINFAQLGQKVLLIDADMRKGWVHKTLKLSNDRGLSNVLSGDRDIAGLIQPSVVSNLSVITAGPVPPDPVELLMSSRLDWLLEKAQAMGYQQIVVDGPPLLGLADAIVLGNQIQHIVFAVKAGGTRKENIKDGLRRLRNAGLAPMGMVLTQARNEHTGEYAFETYYGGDEDLRRPLPPSARTPVASRGPSPALAPRAAGPRIEPTLGPSSS